MIPVIRCCAAFGSRQAAALLFADDSGSSTGTDAYECIDSRVRPLTAILAHKLCRRIGACATNVHNAAAQ